MARKLNDPNNQEGSGLNQALLDAEQQRQMQEQERQSVQPQTATRSRVSQVGQQASPTIKSMPQQQPAGTGTFTNLRKYLEAAKPSQQRIAQVATQRVEGLAGAAQKGIQQAKESFGRNIDAGSLANMGEALGQAQNIIGAARGVTYQPQQVTPPATPPTESTSALTQEQIDAQNEARMNYDPNLIRVGGPVIPPEMRDRADQWKTFLDTTLGDKKEQFFKDLSALANGSFPKVSEILELEKKYGIDRSKFTYIPKEYPVVERFGTTSSTTTQAPTTPPPQQYISPEDQARFAEIINAAYQGPSSLQEAGLYAGAAERARQAQKTIGDVQTATGRERLLRDVFGRTRDYTAGQSLLDQLLLNTSGEGVRSVQEAAQRAGNLEQVMQQAVRETAAQAGQRREAIADIRGQAREALTGARTEEEKAVEKRIDDLITTPAVDEQGNKIAKLDSKGKPVVDAEGNPVYLTEWERLPAYFQDIFRQRQTNKALPLSAREMEILGLSSGQGLFNVGQGAIGGVAAERERLITKDELARQLALQQLAGLDVSKELQKDLKYTDLEKAGTQDLLSSLDVGKFERTLKERIGDMKFDSGIYKGQNVLKSLSKMGLKEKKPTPAQITSFMNKKIKEARNNYERAKKQDVLNTNSMVAHIVKSGQIAKAKKELNDIEGVLNQLKSKGLANVVQEGTAELPRSQVLKDILGEE